jgi:hypothetical protein
MGGTNSRFTLGPCPFKFRSLGELNLEEYWDVSDEHRFFHVTWALQPEIPKGVEIIFDCDLFIQQGPCTCRVFAVFENVRNRSSFVPPSASSLM